MRSILYAEVPCFYAAVERRDDPALEGRPVIVGGDPRKRGQVQAASPDAAAAGVLVGMAMLGALQLCPSARAVRTDMKRYRHVSSQLRASMRRVVDALEPMSLEGAYLDPGPTPDPRAIAERLREVVKQDLGLQLRVGIAPVKFLARLAAEEAPPEGVRYVRPGEEAAFLAPLPLERLPGVGPKTLTTLAECGASSVAELLSLDPARLESLLGNHGLRILEYARGEDPAPIRAARHPKTLSHEHTFDEPQLDRLILSERLQRLAGGLEAGLGQQRLLARSVSIKVRYADSETVTRRQTLPRPIGQAADFVRTAERLLDRTHAGARPIRLLGMVLSGLQPADRSDRQLDLFSEPG